MEFGVQWKGRDSSVLLLFGECGAARGVPNPNDEKGEDRHHEAEGSEQPKSVKIGHGASLLPHAAVEQAGGADCGLSKAVATLRKIACELRLLNAAVGSGEMLGETKLVKLPAAG
jgi:hypothetical protein